MKLTIDGITYNVLKRETPDSHRANGHVNVARHMEEAGGTEDFYMQRPQGKRLYCVRKFDTVYGSVAKVA